VGAAGLHVLHGGGGLVAGFLGGAGGAVVGAEAMGPAILAWLRWPAVLGASLLVAAYLLVVSALIATAASSAVVVAAAAVAVAVVAISVVTLGLLSRLPRLVNPGRVSNKAHTMTIEIKERSAIELIKTSLIT
jgi:hypothetical protein